MGGVGINNLEVSIHAGIYECTVLGIQRRRRSEHDRDRDRDRAWHHARRYAWSCSRSRLETRRWGTLTVHSISAYEGGASSGTGAGAGGARKCCGMGGTGGASCARACAWSDCERLSECTCGCGCGGCALYCGAGAVAGAVAAAVAVAVAGAGAGAVAGVPMCARVGSAMVGRSW